jgi:hypothetical protein
MDRDPVPGRSTRVRKLSDDADRGVYGIGEMSSRSRSSYLHISQIRAAPTHTPRMIARRVLVLLLCFGNRVGMVSPWPIGQHACGDMEVERPEILHHPRH